MWFCFRLWRPCVRRSSALTPDGHGFSSHHFQLLFWSHCSADWCFQIFVVKPPVAEKNQEMIKNGNTYMEGLTCPLFSDSPLLSLSLSTLKVLAQIPTFSHYLFSTSFLFLEISFMQTLRKRREPGRHSGERLPPPRAKSPFKPSSQYFFSPSLRDNWRVFCLFCLFYLNPTGAWCN